MAANHLNPSPLYSTQRPGNGLLAVVTFEREPKNERTRRHHNNDTSRYFSHYPCHKYLEVKEMTITKQNPPTIAVFNNFYDARDHGAKYGRGYSQWRAVRLENGYAVLLADQNGKTLYLTKHGAPLEGKNDNV